MENSYRNPNFIQTALDKGNHRGVIGGMWDEIGQWQFDYLRAQGLKPSDTLVDIGCGSLRGGVHYIPYLEPYHYHGFDLNRDLIEAGLNQELPPDIRDMKTKPENFHAGNSFDYPAAWKNIDTAISISLFSHLNFNSMKQCLLRTKAILRPGAIYHTTIFVSPKEKLLEPCVQHPEVTSHYHQDPFHYTYEDMLHLAYSTGYKLLDILDVGHPRNQQMAQFQLRGL